MWNEDYKLSYILSSSIQIFIFSGDYMPRGIGNEILSRLPLIFCLKLSPDLQGKKKSLPSQFSLAEMWKSEDTVRIGSRRKLQVEVGFYSHLSLISLAFFYHLPTFLRVCSVLSQQGSPLPGASTTFPSDPSEYSSLCSFEGKGTEEKQNLFSVAVTASLQIMEMKLPSQS